MTMLNEYKLEKDWYKNSVIYGLDIKTFYDSDGDGIGDIKGLIQKLDYLSSLGVNCLWIMPFYQTSDRDDGYDVIDHKRIDPYLGQIEDFKKLVEEVHKREMKIIIDLVIHHTSDKHEWFEASRSSTTSEYRDYYIWSDNPVENKDDTSAFPGRESSVWEYDDESQMYYYHKFYTFEPDLKLSNPKVQKEIQDIMDFWLSLGIDGFRVDAATLFPKDQGIPGNGIKDVGEFLMNLREFVESKRPNAVLMGEADVLSKDIGTFFGEGNRLQMLLNFLINENLFLSLAKKTAKPLKDMLEELQNIEFASNSHWVNFVRNIDELNVEKLSKKEQIDIFHAFAPEPDHRIYGRGIRRRIAPMLNGDQKRLKSLFALMFSFPGTPLIAYGDELGMGDDLTLSERISVRIPMQWSDEINGGFSTADKNKLLRIPVESGDFGFPKINADSQIQEDNSLLSFFKKVIRLRLNNRIIGSGKYTVLNLNNDSILGLIYKNDTKTMLIFNNLSSDKITISVEELKDKNLNEIFSDSKYELSDNQNVLLKEYGYRWFEISDKK